MKKIILVIVIAIACVAMAAPAHAEQTFNGPIGTDTPAVTTVIGGAVFSPSTGVYVSIGTSNTAYCVASVHNSAFGKDAGKEYASTSEASTILYQTSVSMSAIVPCATPATGAAPALPSGSWQQ